MKNNDYKKGLRWIITILTFGVCSAIYAAPGDLDTTFGNGGKVRTAFNGASDAGSAVAFQADGKIVVAGEADDNQHYDFLVARYNTDGSLDQTFGEGGRVVTLLASNGYYRQIYTAVVQPDGKILIGGTNTASNGNSDFVVIRYNADGSLDQTFGSSGIVTTDFSGIDEVHALGLLTDGRILAVGGSTYSNGTGIAALARYNANGSLDTTFGSGGKVTTGSVGIATAFVFVSTTRFIVAGTGTTNTDLTLARYNDNGSLDTPFGTNGIIVRTNYQGREAFLTTQSDITGDKILVAKGGNVILRYSVNGILDTTFGTNGTATVNTTINGLLTQGNINSTTRILVSGYKSNPPTSNFAGFSMTKLFLSGAPDTTFGNGGTVVTTLGTDNAVSRSVRLRSNRIVQVGYSYSGTSSQNTTSVAYNLSDGSLDTTFDQDGIRIDDFGALSANANGTAIQPDGKIIAVGSNSFDFAVVRYNQNGTQDNSFGDGGKVTTNINGTDSAEDVVVQPDGKIVVVGRSGENFALVRYLASGALDTTFGSSGIFTGVSGGATAVALQADGKIVAGGTTGSSGTRDFIVARFNQNGSLDTTFGTNGITITGIGADDAANDLKIQTDGKIVVAGSVFTTNSQSFALVRYNSNGTIDQTFGSFGKVVTDIEALSVANSVALQPDGKIVAAGIYANAAFTSLGFAAARYLANGTLDTSFDGDGIVKAQIGVGGDLGYDLAIQPDGKILVVGDSYDGTLTIFAAIRFNPNGSLDNSYGIGGKVAVDVSSGSDNARAVAFDSFGRAVIVGSADGRFALIRLQGDRAAVRTPFDYDGDGKSDLSLFRPSNGYWYLQNSTTGFTYSGFGITGDLIAPADYDGDGKTDLAVFRPSNGAWYLLRSNLGFTQIQFGANGDLPMPADFDGDGKAEIAIFRPSTGVWYTFNVTNNQTTSIAFGINGDTPTAGDYDGDGKADIAVFRQSNGTWYLQRSQLGFTQIQFGASGDKAVPSDYDGDGKTDLAIWRPTNGYWYLNNSSTGFTYSGFGITGDLPAPADYDGDGKTDLGIFRPSNGSWYLQRTTQGFTQIQFGASGDKPTPNAFVP